MSTRAFPAVLIGDLIRRAFYDTRGGLYFPHLDGFAHILVLLHPRRATLVDSEEVGATTDVISGGESMTEGTLAFPDGLLTGHLLRTEDDDTSHLGILFHGDITNNRRRLGRRIAPLLRKPVGVTGQQHRDHRPPEKSADDRRGLVLNFFALEKYPPSEQKEENRQSHLAEKITQLLALGHIKHGRRFQKHHHEEGPKNSSPQGGVDIFPLTAVLHHVYEDVKRKNRERDR